MRDWKAPYCTSCWKVLFHRRSTLRIVRSSLSCVYTKLRVSTGILVGVVVVNFLEVAGGLKFFGGRWSEQTGGAPGQRWKSFWGYHACMMNWPPPRFAYDRRVSYHPNPESCLRSLFTDSTMVMHHETTIWETIFSNHRTSKSKYPGLLETRKKSGKKHHSLRISENGTFARLNAQRHHWSWSFVWC